MQVIDALLDVANESGVAVWYRRLMPEAVGVYMREPGLPPVMVMDADVLLDEALHAAVLSVLLTWHLTLRGERVWAELPDRFAECIRKEMSRQ